MHNYFKTESFIRSLKFQDPKNRDLKETLKIEKFT